MNLNNGYLKNKIRNTPYNKKMDAPEGYLTLRVYATRYKLSRAVVRLRMRSGHVEYIRPSYKMFIKDVPPRHKIYVNPGAFKKGNVPWNAGKSGYKNSKL